MSSEPVKGGAPEEEAYLWDRSGPADPLVERLERELGEFRQRGAAPEMPEEGPVIPRFALRGRVWLAAAAVLVVVGAAAWLLTALGAPSWKVTVLEGTARVGSAPVGGSRRLHVKETLTTDPGSRAHLAMKRLGDVTVGPGSTLQVVSVNEEAKTLRLDRGSIHAVISAPPRMFFVHTPAGTAIDMGCEYTLDVDGAGNTALHVIQGWVELVNGLSASVPAKARCRMDMQAAPGCPWFDDAPQELIDAVAEYELHGGGSAAIRAILDAARPRDSLTLWHLLSHVSGAERSAVVDRLAEFVPLPAGVARTDVLKLDKNALAAWWRDVPGTW